MKLVIDTNIIHEDFHLQGPRIGKLCSAAEKLGYDLMIPEVVVDEMVNQFRRKMLKNLTGYSEVLKMVARTQERADKFDKDVFLQSKVEEYEWYLQNRLSVLKIRVVPYPVVDVKSLVSRELLVKKPFKEGNAGNVGYRDALIWESIKSVCVFPKALKEDPQVEFLTENTRDFSDGSSTLHPDLIEDLRGNGLLENCVSLIPDVKEFFEKRVDVELNEIENIKAALLGAGKFNRFNLKEEIAALFADEMFEELLMERDYDTGQFAHLSSVMEDPSIDHIEDAKIVDVSVKRLNDQSVLVESRALVGVWLTFFIFRSDFLALDEERRPMIIDEGWNEHYLMAQGRIQIDASPSFRMTGKLGKILSSVVRVNSVSVYN